LEGHLGNNFKLETLRSAGLFQVFKETQTTNSFPKTRRVFVKRLLPSKDSTEFKFPSFILFYNAISAAAFSKQRKHSSCGKMLKIKGYFALLYSLHKKINFYVFFH
jgi:hypothetical protein